LGTREGGEVAVVADDGDRGGWSQKGIGKRKRRKGVAGEEASVSLKLYRGEGREKKHSKRQVNCCWTRLGGGPLKKWGIWGLLPH